MAESYYIRVPFDDLERPHWRCLIAEVGGEGAMVFALRLRGMAARSECGGLIARHTGDPMPLGEIATYLGYTVQQMQRSLELLYRHGMAEPVDNGGAGGVIVHDPVLSTHFRRVMPGAAQLQASPRRNKYSRTLTAAERQQLHRTGQLPDDVTILRHVTCHVTDDGVTHQPQCADISRGFGCHVTNSTSISISTSSSRDVNPAVADSTDSPTTPAPPPLPPDIESAIQSLPPHLHRDARQIARDEDQPPDVIATNIQLIASKKDPTGALLRAAIRDDYAAPGRELETAEAERRSEALLVRQLAAETEARQRQAEDEDYLCRRDEALAAYARLSPDIQQILQAEARRDARGIAPMLEPALVQAVERYAQQDCEEIKSENKSNQKDSGCHEGKRNQLGPSLARCTHSGGQMRTRLSCHLEYGRASGYFDVSGIREPLSRKDHAGTLDPYRSGWAAWFGG